MADVHRIFALREDKPALQKLLSKGSIADSLWNDYTKAEQELDKEISELLRDADHLQPGWQKNLLQQAAQIYSREREKEMEESVRKMQASTPSETPAMQRRREELARELIEEEEREKQQRKR